MIICKAQEGSIAVYLRAIKIADNNITMVFCQIATEALN